MIVLSLFDGMSCGRIALERAGIPVVMYISSEVDKYAIQVADKNYPQDSYFRMGDVCGVKAEQLPPIDLLIGGSPCQSFSFAGKRKGMSTKCDLEILSLEQYMGLRAEGFEFQGQSYLFWEYMRILKEVKPKYFLLENVVMTKKWERVLSDAIGVEPIMINSALVSAQNRKRLYWTNIPGVEQPGDRGLVLNDILEDGTGVGAAMRGRYVVDGKRQDHRMKVSGLTTQRLELRDDEKTNALTTVEIDTLVVLATGGNARIGGISEDERGFRPHRGDAAKSGLSEIGRILKPGAKKTDTLTTSHAPKVLINVNPSGKGMNGRVFSIGNLSPTLTTNKGEGPKVSSDGILYRKLTPLECERLQTVPDNYTDCVSNSQRYKMLGNGWTVDVIAYIFKGLK